MPVGALATVRGCAASSRSARRSWPESGSARPAAEHDECLRKLAALEAAIDLAEGGS
jgi:hypothetical protein